MPATVQRVDDSADLPTLASLHQAAFGPYPTHKLLWRDADPEAERCWLAAIFAGTLKKPDEPMFKAVDEEGQMLGFAAWKVKPGKGEERSKEDETFPDLPEGADVELTQKFFGKLDGLRKTYGNEGPHVHLDTLVVLPTAQRKKVGHALLAWGLAEADKLGVPAFLEASEQGVGLYEKFGFVRTQPDLACGPNGAVFVTPMRRPPHPSSQSLKISIHRVTDPADLPTLAPVHREAFSPYTMHKLIWGKVAKEDDNRWMANSLTDSLANPREPIFKAVDERGDVVGFALWKVPPQDREEAKGAEDEKPMKFAAGTDVELAKEFFDKLGLLRKTYGDEGPHVHLNILVVSPKTQRKGVGRALMQWGCDEADRLGVPAWLEASEQGIGLYRKMGFERARQDVYAGPDNAISVTPMRRPPRPRA